MTIALAKSVGSFFQEVVDDAVKSRQLTATQEATSYLVGLLSEFAHPDPAVENTFERPVAFLLDEALRAALLTAYRTAVQWIDAAAGADVPRCRDRDDQKVLELATAARADFLVTRDARVLAMSRRMEKRFGIRVVTQDGLNAVLRA